MTLIEALRKSKRVRRPGVNHGKWIDFGAYFTLTCRDILAADWEVETEPVEGWANVYFNLTGEEQLESILHPTKDEADKNAARDRIRCVKVREVRGEE